MDLSSARAVESLWSDEILQYFCALTAETAAHVSVEAGFISGVTHLILLHPDFTSTQFINLMTAKCRHYSTQPVSHTLVS